ncbi:hypothetical protein AVEN_140826-1 [Araneus ventricosus]|uniref:Mos1 transposase HTH domain-containing protein n=1 Tax=Araneus ventricosus TaxID=182803 RepID=A0A4Y2FR17_ARAVE|nr:hypothetical protein AVEN_140826-1 [Araneus ventricosus]
MEEQRVGEKFCIVLANCFIETLQQAYVKYRFSRFQCYEWYRRRFKSDRTLTKDDPKTGHPSMSTGDFHLEAMRALIFANHRLNVHVAAEDLGINKS